MTTLSTTPGGLEPPPAPLDYECLKAFVGKICTISIEGWSRDIEGHVDSVSEHWNVISDKYGTSCINLTKVILIYKKP